MVDSVRHGRLRSDDVVSACSAFEHVHGVKEEASIKNRRQVIRRPEGRFHLRPTLPDGL
jgi:hypothetical protein